MQKTKSVKPASQPASQFRSPLYYIARSVFPSSCCSRYSVMWVVAVLARTVLCCSDVTGQSGRLLGGLAPQRPGVCAGTCGAGILVFHWQYLSRNSPSDTSVSFYRACALLRCYIARVGSYLPKFWDSLLVPSREIKQSKKEFCKGQPCRHIQNVVVS